MPVVNIEPTAEHPIPFDTEDEVAPTFAEEMAVAGNTAELQVDLGAPLEVDERTASQEKTLIEQAIKNRKTKAFTNPTRLLRQRHSCEPTDNNSPWMQPKRGQPLRTNSWRLPTAATLVMS